MLEALRTATESCNTSSSKASNLSRFRFCRWTQLCHRAVLLTRYNASDGCRIAGTSSRSFNKSRFLRACLRLITRVYQQRLCVFTTVLFSVSRLLRTAASSSLREQHLELLGCGIGRTAQHKPKLCNYMYMCLVGIGPNAWVQLVFLPRRHSENDSSFYLFVTVFASPTHMACPFPSGPFAKCPPAQPLE